MLFCKPNSVFPKSVEKALFNGQSPCNTIVAGGFLCFLVEKSVDNVDNFAFFYSKIFHYF